MTQRPLLAEAGHLARRFFGFLRAHPLTPHDQDVIQALLSGPELDLFWDLRLEDRSHSLLTMQRFDRIRPSDREGAAAALLHDIGKRHAPIGAIARSVATLCDHAHIPIPAQWRRYREHGRLGAADLEAAGSSQLAIEFARLHPAGCPPGFDVDQWDALLEADDM